MEITQQDHQYFSLIVDRLHEVFEIASDFCSYNGYISIPTEKVADLAISEFKTWLISEQGNCWLGTLGYSFGGLVTTTTSAFCYSCSGLAPVWDYHVCERCGHYICSPCSTVVDSKYNIRWCNNCAITNLK
jgi:hypothetical protein